MSITYKKLISIITYQKLYISIQDFQCLLSITCSIHKISLEGFEIFMMISINNNTFFLILKDLNGLI